MLKEKKWFNAHNETDGNNVITEIGAEKHNFVVFGIQIRAMFFI